MRDVVYENKSEPIAFTFGEALAPTPHLHKEVEIVYTVNGRALAYADRSCTEISNGDLFISFPNQIHYYENSQIGDYYVIIFSADTIFGMKNIFNESLPEQNVYKIGSGTEAEKMLCEAMQQAKTEFGKTVSVGLLSQVIGTLAPEFKLKPRTKTDNSTLKSVLNYCNENFQADITLDDIADRLHISKYHISHLFNNKLGIGFNNYINNLRITKACELLRETDKKTTDISVETGFGSIRTFNRAFLQVMQISPLQYRKISVKNNKES